MRKSETEQLFTFNFSYRKIYILLENISGKTCHICFTVFFTWQVIGNAVTPTPIQIFISSVDAILRSKILDNRLGFLTQILVATDYFLYLYISDIQLPSIQGKKCILIWEVNFIIKSIRKRTETLAKRLFSFSIIVFNMKFLVTLFIRKRFARENCLVHYIQVTGSTYCELFFKLNIPQRYVHELQRYWKKSVNIGVKNFANL